MVQDATYIVAFSDASIECNFIFTTFRLMESFEYQPPGLGGSLGLCNPLMLLVFFSFLLSELCREKVMVAYAKPQQRKKKESERLRGEIVVQIKSIDLRFERW